MAAAHSLAAELQTERDDVLDSMDDVEDVDPEETRRAREAWRKYGDDFAARLADLEAGRHPYQQPR